VTTTTALRARLAAAVLPGLQRLTSATERAAGTTRVYRVLTGGSMQPRYVPAGDEALLHLYVTHLLTGECPGVSAERPVSVDMVELPQAVVDGLPESAWVSYRDLD
jgi:hypothetical protein